MTRRQYFKLNPEVNPNLKADLQKRYQSNLDEHYKKKGATHRHRGVYYKFENGIWMRSRVLNRWEVLEQQPSHLQVSQLIVI